MYYVTRNHALTDLWLVVFVYTFCWFFFFHLKEENCSGKLTDFPVLRSNATELRTKLDYNRFRLPVSDEWKCAWPTVNLETGEHFLWYWSLAEHKEKKLERKSSQKEPHHELFFCDQNQITFWDSLPSLPHQKKERLIISSHLQNSPLIMCALFSLE